MSFGVTVAHVCVVLFYFVYPSVGDGPGGWVDFILLATRVLPPYRGWFAGQLYGCFGHMASTCNKCC